MRTSECPECRWVPVVDETGRRRLVLRWQLPVAAPAESSVARAA
ncbi:hypothetical protein ACI797_06550 [Geodermatophilus sp. SYSU D00691]